MPTDKATYRIAIIVGEPYVAVANGVPTSITDLGKRRRFVWEQKQPMASYLAIIDIDTYRLDRKQSASGIPIRNYLTEITTLDGSAALRARRRPCWTSWSGWLARIPLTATGPS